MKPDFTKDSMQLSLLKAGLTPRDLTRIMPCHPATLYTFLKTGGGRAMSLFCFRGIQDFLEEAVQQNLLPTDRLRKPEQRQEGIKRAFNHWTFRVKTEAPEGTFKDFNF